MYVKNKKSTRQTISAPGHSPVSVEPGEAVDVDDDLARALLDQPDRWAPHGPTNVDTSIPGVLAQVGENKDRARTALDAEQASDKPRKSLLDALSKIINAQEGDQS